MAYFAPYIDEAGLHLPSYGDIVADHVEKMKSIFGRDIYLENDSADYEAISINALYLHDAYQLLQLIYNNRGPQTAIGSGLDGVVKLNGIARKSATYSSVVLTISGEPETRIEKGFCIDETGNKWILPDLFKIPSDGVLEVSAQAEKIGDVTALPGQINIIGTPTRGWISVTNKYAAIIGQPVEKDSTLRSRQTNSTMLPSKGILDGIYGAISDINGVTRLQNYENDKNETDANGLPPHSLSFVVEGEMDSEIAEQVHLRKTPGCNTFGDVVMNVKTKSGQLLPIRFFRPRYRVIDVTISVLPLDGYTTLKSEEVISSVTLYLNSLKIGEKVRTSSLFGAAMLPVVSLTKPVYAVVKVECADESEEALVQDLEIRFNEVSQAGKIEIKEIT